MDQIFKMSWYQKQTKPNKNWGFQIGRFFPKKVLQNSNFLTF